jgi:hypothetical protein
MAVRRGDSTTPQLRDRGPVEHAMRPSDDRHRLGGAALLRQAPELDCGVAGGVFTWTPGRR